LEEIVAVKPQFVEMLGQQEADKLLAALDEMQMAFMEAFQHRPEFLDTHHWNVCKNLWRLRHSDAPIEKTKAIDWRRPDGEHAIIGENKAREHIDAMIKDGFIEEYFIREISKRVKYVRGTKKLNDALERIFRVGVDAIKKEFS
jgi:predicted glycoside hydrolase/deacetylase ChbG (UPF0249 family)